MNTLGRLRNDRMVEMNRQIFIIRILSSRTSID